MTICYHMYPYAYAYAYKIRFEGHINPGSVLAYNMLLEFSRTNKKDRKR